ncbi:hypothetical protein BS78_K199600 [Paspalum vaginatum]|uniref:Reverse transcriptase zinc-binding domain-containing protein n=1 Tax=Paspalum vaginatum TaxID=158149 RepID=A0A9W8CCM7_9POAL|nr:hypothetical protein BS78_K199600 [Paspalum vaginatum]
MVIKPKQHGGLGVINLQIQNEGLLLKQLHKFYARKNILGYISYGILITKWKDILRLHDNFKELATCRVGDGASMLFWEDNWLNGRLGQKFPMLVSFDLDHMVSIKEVQEAKDLVILTKSKSNGEEQDVWVLTRDAPNFSIAVYYKQKHQYTQVSSVFAKLWKCKCTMCTNLFFWLLLVARLNTKKEDIDHLFFQCPFARRCWQSLGIQWDSSLHLNERLLQARRASRLPFFMEIYIIAMWELCKLRNRKIFEGQNASFGLWLQRFKEEIKLQSSNPYVC